MITRRAAGAALILYGAGTFAANELIAAPGGDYENSLVKDFIAPGHRPVAFLAAWPPWRSCRSSSACATSSAIGPTSHGAWASARQQPE